MRTVAVIHFQPIELYPPITNLLEEVGSCECETRFNVFTRRQDKVIDYKCKNKNVRIYRFSNNRIKGKNTFVRVFKYLYFYIITLLCLVKDLPQKVIYFETISFAPVFIYMMLRRIFNSDVSIFCHYHEYNTESEYNSGMKLNRWLHSKEKLSYESFCWISHTNDERLQLFKSDNNITSSNLYIMPNYPPGSWKSERKRLIQHPVRFVLIGVVDFESMYIEEFRSWIVNLGGKATWDIYTFSEDQDVINRLLEGGDGLIKVHSGVPYYDLPNILKEYHIGVILYNGHTANYVFNAPNKFFEYHTCGLDVWYPTELQGMKMYTTQKIVPKVIEIDFRNIGNYDLDKLTDVNGMAFSMGDFTSRNASRFLLDKLDC